MTPRAFWTSMPGAIGAAALGLVSLGAILFIERWLLRFATPLLGGSWTPTARIALECAALMVVGWLVGRWGWPGVLLLAVAIALLRLADLFWLFRLFLDCFESSRYWTSFLTSFGIHILRLGSLFAGANWSRPREPAVLQIK